MSVIQIQRVDMVNARSDPRSSSRERIVLLSLTNLKSIFASFASELEHAKWAELPGRTEQSSHRRSSLNRADS